jgi:hypothetical protein
MAVAVVIVLGFLMMLGLVLSTVRRLRPEDFRLKATVTKWLSLDLEMRSGYIPGTRHHEPPRDDENRRELETRSDDGS